MAIPTMLSGAAGRALKTLTPLTSPTGPIDALALVNRAMPDMRSALGGEVAQTLGTAMFDASRRGSTRTAASREQIRLGLETLETAAHSTAVKRVVIGGSLAVGGGVAGLIALTSAGGEA